MKTSILQQAIAAEKRRRGAPWTYHERDPVKMVENVKRMVALGEAIREEFPGMPEAMVEHCVKRARGSRRPVLPGWTEVTERVVEEFALFLERQGGSDSDKLLKQWKGSKCTHQ